VTLIPPPPDTEPELPDDPEPTEVERMDDATWAKLRESVDTWPPPAPFRTLPEPYEILPAQPLATTLDLKERK
jgi:hypothetical protein